MKYTQRSLWKITPLRGRTYDFIIGIDILNFLNAQINIEQGQITLNGKVSYFLNNPYKFNQIYRLEAGDPKVERLQLNHLNHEERREIIRLLNRYNKLLFREGDLLTNTTEIQHEIKTITQQQIYSKLYRYPPQPEAEVRKQIREMEEQVIIRKSHSRYASPLIVVPKKTNNSCEKKYSIRL